MANIPTELLRTLIAVVDFRSYTKASQFLGLTQPAVSAQLKRLQEILQADVFDKTEPGVRLTPNGEVIVQHARRLLAIHDRLVDVTSPFPNVQTLRIGVPSEFVPMVLASACVDLRAQSPGLRLHISSDESDHLLRDLADGAVDVALAHTSETPGRNVRAYWPEDVVWARSGATKVDPAAAVPLVSFSDNCVYTRLAISALSQAGREHELRVTSPNVLSLASAVQNGFGVMPVARRAVPPELSIWHDAPLPQLPGMICGVYIRDDRARDRLGPVADFIAKSLRPGSPEPAAAPFSMS